MKKFILAVMGASLFGAPVVAKPTKGYFTLDATGCMILRECVEDVDRVYSIENFRKEYPNSNWNFIETEFNQMMDALSKINVKVFLADQKYFAPGHRGVYHTVSNNFYLNKAFMHRPHVLMSVMRHEGWHAAQDCMAGTINNSMIAIIHPEKSVPKLWRDIVEDNYPSSAVPWEAEATWAGKTEGMTLNALKACARGKMWEEYTPTPLTRKWLKENGYIK